MALAKKPLPAWVDAHSAEHWSEPDAQEMGIALLWDRKHCHAAPGLGSTRLYLWQGSLHVPVM